VRFKNSGDLLGNLMLVRQSSDHPINWVRESAIQSISVGQIDDGAFWASFSGKATYFSPGEGTAIPNFLVSVEDNGMPGDGVDKFWIEINRLPGTLPDMSMDSDAVENAVEIEEGNIFVHYYSGILE
jgi:hypothetical protein